MGFCAGISYPKGAEFVVLREVEIGTELMFVLQRLSRMAQDGQKFLYLSNNVSYIQPIKNTQMYKTLFSMLYIFFF